MTTGPKASPTDQWSPDEIEAMAVALAAAADARGRTSPNPWVGCAVLAPPATSHQGRVAVSLGSGSDGTRIVGVGATEPPGGAHAEVVALGQAGDQARGSTVVTTLEPCAHHGRTPPCVDALVAAGVARVVVGILDPDDQVAGRGVEALRHAGIDVEVGLAAAEVERQLAPYLKHRRTGRPWVVLKLAATLDGRIAAPDGSSKWLTGEAARNDVHRLRSESDAILVGAGTIRADDPALTVRGSDGRPATDHQPVRVVLGAAPADARVHPSLALHGPPEDVLDELGRRQVLQVMIEGGAHVAHQFHAAGLVDRYVVYLAPALFGGDDAVPMFAGPGSPDMSRLWRGKLVDMVRLGDDIKVELAPADPRSCPSGPDAGSSDSTAGPPEQGRRPPDPDRKAA